MAGARILTVFLIATMFAGCADIGVDGMRTTDHKSVGNVKDSFGYSMSATNKTKVETYKWENTASKAMIGLSGSVQQGELRLVIKDAAGLTVFQETYTGNGSESVSTNRGLSGMWTIQMTFDDYYGALSMGVTAQHGA